MIIIFKITEMSLCTLVLLVTVFSCVVFSQHFDGYDNGYWPKCAPQLMDLTFSKNASDVLEIMIIRFGKKPFIHYPIKDVLNLLKDRDFNASRKTMIYAHGYVDLPKSTEYPVFKTYLHKPEYNVLMLNAVSMVSDILYMRSARAVKYIGNRMGVVLGRLMRAGLNIDTVEIIGHSLGAHIAGFTGKSFFKATGKKIPKITALDPAGPCFRQAKPADRLDKSDAEFVQVIHTNGGVNGLMNAIGHVDFYVNGGRWQPSEYGLFCLVLCSHGRSLMLWQAAMGAAKGSGFIGVECPSVDLAGTSNCFAEGKTRTAIMGPNADPKINGIFYVRTSGNYPFYLGKQGTKPISFSQ